MQRGELVSYINPRTGNGHVGYFESETRRRKSQEAFAIIRHVIPGKKRIRVPASNVKPLQEVKP